MSKLQILINSIILLVNYASVLSAAENQYPKLVGFDKVVSRFTPEKLSGMTKLVYTYEKGGGMYKEHYSLEVTKDSSSCTYSGVLEAVNNKITLRESPALFEELTQIMLSNSYENCRQSIFEDNNVCSCGKEETLKLFAQDTELFSGSIYRCSGKNSGTLCGSLLNALLEKLPMGRCNSIILKPKRSFR